jgi:hypothetical protein
LFPIPKFLRAQSSPVPQGIASFLFRNKLLNMSTLRKTFWVDKPWLTPEANALKKKEIMAKQADSGSAVAGSKGIASADRQITMLKDRLLPYVRPSLLSHSLY